MWASTLETLGADTGNSRGTFLVGPGSANTKGSYVEFDASTAFDVEWMQVIVSQQNGAVTADFLFDIATGAAASEVVLIADLAFSSVLLQSDSERANYLVPIAIASGTRIACRCQLSTTSTGSILNLLLVIAESADISGSSAAQTYGADTSDSGGTEIDPGGSANTKGSYVEMSASSSADLNYLVITFGNKSNTARSAAGFLLDIATGAAASEVVLVADLAFVTGANTDVIQSGFAIGVPPVSSGTRLAVRAQSETTDATDRLFDLVLTALDPPEPAGGGGETSHVF